MPPKSKPEDCSPCTPYTPYTSNQSQPSQSLTHTPNVYIGPQQTQRQSSSTQAGPSRPRNAAQTPAAKKAAQAALKRASGEIKTWKPNVYVGGGDEQTQKASVCGKEKMVQGQGKGKQRVEDTHVKFDQRGGGDSTALTRGGFESHKVNPMSCDSQMAKRRNDNQHAIAPRRGGFGHYTLNPGTCEPPTHGHSRGQANIQNTNPQPTNQTQGMTLRAYNVNPTPATRARGPKNWTKHTYELTKCGHGRRSCRHVGFHKILHESFPFWTPVPIIIIHPVHMSDIRGSPRWLIRNILGYIGQDPYEQLLNPEHPGLFGGKGVDLSDVGLEMMKRTVTVFVASRPLSFSLATFLNNFHTQCISRSARAANSTSNTAPRRRTYIPHTQMQLIETHNRNEPLLQPHKSKAWGVHYFNYSYCSRYCKGGDDLSGNHVSTHEIASEMLPFWTRNPIILVHPVGMDEIRGTPHWLVKGILSYIAQDPYEQLLNPEHPSFVNRDWFWKEWMPLRKVTIANMEKYLRGGESPHSSHSDKRTNQRTTTYKLNVFIGTGGVSQIYSGPSKPHTQTTPKASEATTNRAPGTETWTASVFIGTPEPH
ncbi:hypothetical protein EJ08DRAFT_666030 [Tothia fuscella]|uniref:Uncharacterized protein n=1 Tax=Tothia fuscella TaxID=1048955 RepID=A0A9P4TTB7_9PEZI|nr:hypothetical protein EJ08DRAFT_666030 [Tothia fuscella]